MSPDDRKLPDDGSLTIPEDSWDRYWRYGFLTSCADAFDENYQGVLRDAWENFFNSLPKSARVLDIGTGNGAVAVIANEIAAAHELDFEIHGIDQAIIDPQTTTRSGTALLDGIHFHSRTAAEHTPFEPASIDAVTGQYAFEYTDVENTIDEFVRIVKPGGRIMFVMHHGDSIVLTTTREELRLAELLFSGQTLFDATADLIKKLATVAPAQRASLAQDTEAEALRNTLNETAAGLTAAIKSSPHPEMLKTAMNYASQAFADLDKKGLAAALEQLQEHQRDLKANVGRLKDLQRASVDEAKLRKICAKMRASGFDVPPPKTLFHDEKRLIGWYLVAEKTA